MGYRNTYTHVCGQISFQDWNEISSDCKDILQYIRSGIYITLAALHNQPFELYVLCIAIIVCVNVWG